MLIDKGAKLENGSEHPLLTALQRGSRECFVALIDGREEIVLNNYQDHSLAYHAIQYDTTLLPLLASVMEKEHKKQLNKNFQSDSTFPPSDLSNKDRKRFENALKYEDHFLPYEVVRKSIKQYLCPWHILTDKPIENLILTEDNDNENDNQYEYEAATASTSRNNEISPSPSINSANKENSAINNDFEEHYGYSTSNTAKGRKSNKNNEYNSSNNNNNNTTNHLASYSEDEVSSDHLVFSNFDDEDQVLKTNSDPFKAAGPGWVPLSQRNPKNQNKDRHQKKIEGSSRLTSQKKSKNKYEISDLSEGTYEQSLNDQTHTNDNYTNAYYTYDNHDDYNDDYNDDYFYEEEDEEEEESFED